MTSDWSNLFWCPYPLQFYAALCETWKKFEQCCCKFTMWSKSFKNIFSYFSSNVLFPMTIQGGHIHRLLWKNTFRFLISCHACAIERWPESRVDWRPVQVILSRMCDLKVARVQSWLACRSKLNWRISNIKRNRHNSGPCLFERRIRRRLSTGENYMVTTLGW